MPARLQHQKMRDARHRGSRGHHGGLAREMCIVMAQHDLSAELLAPDFYRYAAAPIAAVHGERNDALVVELG